MPQIQPVSIGLPPKMATKALVRVLGFDTTQTTAVLYYELSTEENEVLWSDNLALTEEQFTHINDPVYIEDIVFDYLGVERLAE